jgi:hypothetical protein
MESLNKPQITIQKSWMWCRRGIKTIRSGVILQKLTVAHLDKKLHAFLESVHSLQCSHESAIGPYPQPAEFSPQLETLFVLSVLVFLVVTSYGLLGPKRRYLRARAHGVTTQRSDIGTGTDTDVRSTNLIIYLVSDFHETAIRSSKLYHFLTLTVNISMKIKTCIQ